MDMICFYSLGLLTIIFTVLTVLSRNIMHALICLIMSFVFTAGVFFLLGAYFVGALEIIIYAGAIMVLFIFVIMMFNFKKDSNYSIVSYTSTTKIVGYLILFCLFLSLITYVLFSSIKHNLYFSIIDSKQLGYKFFSDYIFIIELASILLLSALVLVLHIGKHKYQY